MADIPVIRNEVDASPDALIERVTLGAEGKAGEPLYQDGANGWKPADANALASAQARCLLLGSGVLGTTYPSGAVVDAVFFGKVSGLSGMTPGDRCYVSPTEGALDQTAPAAAGDYPFVFGWAFAADTIFVQPQTAIPTVNS